MENWLRSSIDYSDVIVFCLLLEEENYKIWRDSFGEYRISVNSYSLEERLLNYPDSKIFISDQIAAHLKNIKKTHVADKSDTIISIGTFETHNQARIYCEKKEKYLITVPTPLSNDSFGTNRAQFQNISLSHESLYPSETIFDLELIKESPSSTNILGIGEFSGLFFSIIDYFLSRQQPVPLNVLDFIIERINLFTNLDLNNLDDIYRNLAINLVFKCLIMRKNIDHQIGCGIDHLIGGALERKLNISHGQAVYLGSIISMLIFPDWERFGLYLPQLITFGNKNGLVSQDLIDQVLKLDLTQLIQEAMNLRPDRPSMLRSISFVREGNIWAKFLSHIN